MACWYAVSTAAFRQAIGMLRRVGTCALVGLPPGEFPTPIFDVVLNGLSIRGSIVGTRNDIAEALAFAADGKVKAHYEVEPLETDQQHLRSHASRRDPRPDRPQRHIRRRPRTAKAGAETPHDHRR